MAENHSRRRQRRSCCEFHAKDRFSRRYTPVIPSPSIRSALYFLPAPPALSLSLYGLSTCSEDASDLCRFILYTQSKVTSVSTETRYTCISVHRFLFSLLPPPCPARALWCLRFQWKSPSARRHAKSSENSRNFSSTTDTARPLDSNVLDEARLADTFWDRQVPRQREKERVREKEREESDYNRVNMKCSATW